MGDRAPPGKGTAPTASAELVSWLHSQHYALCGAPELGGRLAPYMDRFKRSSGGDRRVFLRYLRVLAEADPGAVFYPTPITASTGGDAPIIGILLSQAAESPPSHIWCGGSLESRDGEYRTLLVRTEDLEGAEILPIQEAKLLESVEAGQVELVVGGGGAVASWADEKRIALKVLALVLNKSTFVLSYSDGIAAFREEVRVRNPELLGKNLHWAKAETWAALGAKLVPLYAREVFRHEDLRLGAWREHAVERAAADLVLNFVCPGLPLYAGDHLVAESRASLYNNKAMKLRFARSLAAQRVTEQIRGARQALAESPVLAGSERGAKLDARLLDALEYAQSYSLVSGVASIHATETVGIALGGISSALLTDLILVGRTPAPTPAPVPASPALAAELGTGFVFGLVFALHCLHSRAHAAHGDIHINNLAANGNMPAEQAVRDGNRFFFYAVGSAEAEVYCFPQPRARPSVLDFSRSLLGPGFPGADADFFADQAPRVLRALHAQSPEFVADHESSLRAVLELGPETTFPLICAADFLALGRAIRPALVGTPAEAAAASFEAEAQRAYAAILGATAAAANAADFRRLAKTPLPGAGLLAKVFGAHRFPEWVRGPAAKKAIFIDGYSALNPLRYSIGGSGGRGARRPPWADPAEISRRLGALSPAEAFALLARPPPPVAPPRRAPAWGILVAAEAEAQAELDGAAAEAAGAAPAPN